MEETKEKILEFWSHKNSQGNEGKLVTHGDIQQVNIEISLISSLIKATDKLLDIGCGNGFSTDIYAQKCETAVGLDYSTAMVASANKAFNTPKLYFIEGNVLHLDKQIGTFSLINSTRCLINLSSWEEQMTALQKLHALLEPGGRLILSEGTLQGREQLNGLRKSLGLEEMPKVWHNLDFDEEKLFPFLSERFEIKQDIRLGLYDVLVRAYYPSGIAPEPCQYGTNFQVAARKLYEQMDRNTFREYSKMFILELIKK